MPLTESQNRVQYGNRFQHNDHKQRIDVLWFDVSALLILPKGYITGIPRTIRKVLEYWHKKPWTKIKYCALHPEHGVLEVNEDYLFRILELTPHSARKAHHSVPANQIAEKVEHQKPVAVKPKRSKAWFIPWSVRNHVNSFVFGPNARSRKYLYLPYYARHKINMLRSKRNKPVAAPAVVAHPHSHMKSYAPYPEGSIVKELDSTDRKLVLSLGGLWLLGHTDHLFEKIHRDKKTSFASLIYDLIPIYSPHYSAPNQIFRSCTNGMLKISDLVLTISKYSKLEIEKYARDNHLDAGNIEVITLGSDVLSDKIEGKPIIRSPFVLTVGSIEVRKNHYGMYMIWRKLINELGRDQVPLLIMAGKPGWQGDGIVYLIQNDPVVKGKILVQNGLTDNELAWLYSKCLFTLYPSRYEGWGLPVEESFAYGKLCLTTHSTSLPEVGGDFADYFDSENDQAFVDAVKKALDSKYRAGREKYIRENYRQNTWNACAVQVQRILNENYTFQECDEMVEAPSNESADQNILSFRRAA